MLMIDIGNTRIKCAVWQGNAWESIRSLPYQHENLQAQLDVLVKTIPVQSIYVACVVDGARNILVEWFQRHWSLQPVFAGSTDSLCGVINAYENPDALGVDRWLALVAAYTKFRLPVCVIDCGTAVTVDVVDGKGLHRGGLIMPGLQLMRSSLFGNTSKLSSSQGELVELANNTADAIESGCIRLLASGLSKIAQQQLDKFPGIQIVITGGDGKLVSHAMGDNALYIESLVLDGLRIFAKQDC